MFIIFCSSSTSKRGLIITNGQTDIANKQDELILGERIDGPANVRDSANGKIIFTLNDDVLIETAPQEKNGNKLDFVFH